MAGTTKAQIKAYNAKNKAPSLKSQGAGYSTTNRQGVTTFFKSSKDASGYTDSNSKGKPISKFDASGSLITSEAIKPTPDLLSTLPKPPAVDGLYGVQDSNNSALAAATGATFDTKTKQMTPAVQNQAQDTLQQYLSYLDSAQNELPSSESMVKAQRKEIRPYEQNVQRYQNELNTIAADREKAILSLEGQGRGQTEGFIGGEQARISREAAIRALPVQAQLAAAQQDLDSARSYTTQLFQARAQDAQARYNYKKEIGQTIFSYLNQQEQRAYAERQKEDDRAFSLEQANRNNLKQLSLQAIEYGQGALAGEIMRLDPTSPTFDQDYADVTSRLRKPVAVGNGTVTGGISDITAAIIADPSLFDNITPTLKGNVITELHAQGYDTSNLGTKSLSDAAIKQIADTQKALDDLAGLKTMIQGNTDQLGPIKGLQALNPWSPARKLQADVDRVRQTVGKALEGGVLRKEDEEKYKKILATLTDTPDTAVHKIDALISSIQRDIETFKSLQQSSGRSLNVKAPLQTGGTKPIDVNSLRTKYGY